MKNIFNRLTIITLLALISGHMVASAQTLAVQSYSFDDPITTTTETTTTGACINLTYKMAIGSKDLNTEGDVSGLQSFLYQKGYLKNTPTGYFGYSTRSAVQSFQKDNGISSNGFVGSFTRGRIKEITCELSTRNSSNPSVDSSNSTINVSNSRARAMNSIFSSSNTSTQDTSTTPPTKSCYFDETAYKNKGFIIGDLTAEDKGRAFRIKGKLYFINDSSAKWQLYNTATGIASDSSLSCADGHIAEIIIAPKVITSVQSSTQTSSNAASFIFSNSSIGDGTKIVTLKQTIVGAGPNLKACFNTMSSSILTGPCSQDSVFTYLKDQTQIGWSYNETTDTYSTNKNISSLGYPDTNYFTKFITSAGGKMQRIWGTTKVPVAAKVVASQPTPATPSQGYSAPNAYNQCPDGSARRTTTTGPGDTGCGGAVTPACPGVAENTVWSPGNGNPPCGLAVRTSSNYGTSLLPGQQFIAPSSYSYNSYYGGWSPIYSTADQMLVNNAENVAREERLEMQRAFMAANNLNYLIDGGVNFPGWAAWEAQWRASHPSYLGIARYVQ